LAGLDLNKARNRLVIASVSGVATQPEGFTTEQVAEAVRARSRWDKNQYPTRRAAYDLAKLIGKGLVQRVPGRRRYQCQPQSLGVLCAYVLLRDQVIKPLLATVFSFGAVLDECLEGDLGIVLAALLKFGPGRLWVKVGLEGHQADAQGREVAVEVVVFGAGFVFAHAGVAHPMVAAFTAGPVSAGQMCKVAGAVGRRGMAGGVEGDRGLFVLVEGGGALDHGQRARSGQSGLQGLERIDFYLALVAASVVGVRFFCVGKRGVALAFCTAAL